MIVESCASHHGIHGLLSGAVVRNNAMVEASLSAARPSLRGAYYRLESRADCRIAPSALAGGITLGADQAALARHIVVRYARPSQTLKQ